MPNYRRVWVPGGTYFFTTVTARRRAIFQDEGAVNHLRRVVRRVRNDRPFEIVAAVVLPDHLHMIWTLPAGDADYSTRWAAIKAGFTKAYLADGGLEIATTEGERRGGHRGVWQRRYFEHLVRDEEDLQRHPDYVHFNPVKHGLVRRPIDWPYSSLHRYVRAGWLPVTWGTDETPRIPEGDHALE